MATHDYLKQATGSLYQAIDARKQEISDLQQQIASKDAAAKTRINEIKQQEAESVKDAAEADDSATTASHEREIQMLRIEESQIKDQFTQFKQDVDKIINTKQQNINDITQTIRTIENDWYGI